MTEEMDEYEDVSVEHAREILDRQTEQYRFIQNQIAQFLKIAVAGIAIAIISVLLNLLSNWETLASYLSPASITIESNNLFSIAENVDVLIDLHLFLGILSVMPIFFLFLISIAWTLFLFQRPPPSPFLGNNLDADPSISDSSNKRHLQSWIMKNDRKLQRMNSDQNRVQKYFFACFVALISSLMIFSVYATRSSLIAVAVDFVLVIGTLSYLLPICASVVVNSYWFLSDNWENISIKEKVSSPVSSATGLITRRETSKRRDLFFFESICLFAVFLTYGTILYAIFFICLVWWDIGLAEEFKGINALERWITIILIILVVFGPVIGNLLALIRTEREEGEYFLKI